MQSCGCFDESNRTGIFEGKRVWVAKTIKQMWKFVFSRQPSFWWEKNITTYTWEKISPKGKFLSFETSKEKRHLVVLGKMSFNTTKKKKKKSLSITPHQVFIVKIETQNLGFQYTFPSKRLSNELGGNYQAGSFRKKKTEHTNISISAILAYHAFVVEIETQCVIIE